MSRVDLSSLRPPVFVLGSPRSGTTLLRLMLTCHPAIVIPPECGFAVWLADRFEPWAASDVPRFTEAVVASRKFETWGVDSSSLRDFLTEAQPVSYADACSLVYVFYARAQGRPFARWGDKNNFYVHHVADVARIFGEVAFVHIVRDGRGVAASYLDVADKTIESAYRPRLPKEIAAVASEWRGNVMQARASLAALGTPYIEIRYEDLVRSPERELSRVCDFLGEPYDDAMLEYPARNRVQQLEPTEFLQWKQRTLDAPDPANADRWKRVLTVEQVAAFEAVAGDVLSAYGFRDS